MTSQYLSGLVLDGRRVVVVGGGGVAQRRLPRLIESGAEIDLISPSITPTIEGLLSNPSLHWIERGYQNGDLDGAWYVVVATDDTEVNEQVSAEAEERRIFCVRSDDRARATAWTPASGQHDHVTIGVLGAGDHRRSAAVRDAILEGLRTGELGARDSLDKHPGVYLVGGGPGDPDLITVRGRRLLAEADVVVADRLAPQPLLDELHPDVELIDAAKLPRGRAAQQEEINRILVERGREGKVVVRLKGGDPYVFGRGFEEALACAEAGVPWTVVPGISSSISVPAVNGIPVTHRGVTHEFTVVSGHIPPSHPDSLINWDALAQLNGTLVLLMAVENLPAITERLIAGGRVAETPAAAIADGTLPGQRMVSSDLAGIAAAMQEAGVGAPAIVVIGNVVDVAAQAR
ncbi:uroporphyrin-III C-methyltransferase/precorrin-2 dehydrogenase/sirohydrochlorin ferrochelatase [Kribbella antiqua]|uniref:Uroporphyrin-III C-methyltransferase/precorrin-2 dehydrogenase/sirohydrochlorin ferrochelatase n=1 Tax=Kribbella antiqua TaxID=2512217 RepID=A0A4R2IW29_9ACTN|nr:uroporphyrinogen-III C-methyltransferase [Kribbella antiqua]TCO49981.1 uroporphyrin-III C-methyltransferase/precorrin-2 dehydrogenase/sirohydrochlorin ferrochelatase [Kribbella antiqua]